MSSALGTEAAPRTKEDLLAHSREQWRPASRRELLILIAYFAAIAALTDILNIRFGVELLTISVAAAALFITRRPQQFIRDWWFFLAALIMWSLSGVVAGKSPFPWHLEPLLQADRLIAFQHDPVVLVQHGLFHAQRLGLLDVACAAIYNLHVPEPFIAGYFLWRLNRTVYLQFATASILLLILGFLTFVFFPAVPPWMASTWFHRLPGVVNGFGIILSTHPLPFHGAPLYDIFSLHGDPVAAFPSEHAAFPVLELLFFSRLARRASLLFLLWIAGVFFSVLYLGSHWVIDVLAGWLYAVVIFAGVRFLAGGKLAPTLLSSTVLDQPKV